MSVEIVECHLIVPVSAVEEDLCGEPWDLDAERRSEVVCVLDGLAEFFPAVMMGCEICVAERRRGFLPCEAASVAGENTCEVECGC
jgi:hypothetical protein